MFKITPIQDKEMQKKYIELVGGVFRPEYFAYAMADCETGELMGVAQFEISGEEGNISDLREIPGRDDFEAMFILGRQTMNFINLCGASTCTANTDAAERRLLTAIGFKETDGRLFATLDGMFDGHCGSH